MKLYELSNVKESALNMYEQYTDKDLDDASIDFNAIVKESWLVHQNNNGYFNLIQLSKPLFEASSLIIKVKEPVSGINVSNVLKGESIGAWLQARIDEGTLILNKSTVNTVNLEVIEKEDDK